MGRTTEVSADWSSICDIYENALRRLRTEVPDITVAGGHSSHSYVNGTNMYFIYYYNVNCPPERGGCEVPHRDQPHHLRRDAEAGRLRGAPPRHGQGTHAVGPPEYGSSYYILERLKRAFDPNDIMNKGNDHPGLTGPTPDNDLHSRNLTDAAAVRVRRRAAATVPPASGGRQLSAAYSATGSASASSASRSPVPHRTCTSRHSGSVCSAERRWRDCSWARC